MNADPALVVGLLRAEDAALAYPLVRAAYPAMARGTWMRLARRALRTGPRGRHGILVARHGPACAPCGLISFRCDPDMRHGRVLTAEHFVALTFGEVWSVLDAFLPALENMACKAGCGSARVILPGNQQALLARMAARGRVAGHPVAIRTLIEISQNMA
ncbi:hypothetical protein [Gluconacetobacter takamatsuzukensis]|uniref:Uncharacterized protein n=1 Tax=Gluconacetobacter takamatsuzukensis TaxID=1286190 RepID=A0A7W4KBY9_9PROT|nr:hypothetical protein [Gluconacetobacter takamatsuzukensis]MBB2204136.1 hypothetical protein [Gluconacetobacter takamatsuzukensis]